MDRSGRSAVVRHLTGAALGWLLALVGAALCVLGWYAVSGERFTARQVPYLASATAPGSALIVAGVLWAAIRLPAAPPAPAVTAGEGEGGGEWEPPEVAGEAPALGGGLVAVEGGTLCHRPGCPLVVGKPQAATVDAAAVRARGLAPCPVCEPDVLPPGGDGDGPPGGGA